MSHTFQVGEIVCFPILRGEKTCYAIILSDKEYIYFLLNAYGNIEYVHDEVLTDIYENEHVRAVCVSEMNATPETGVIIQYMRFLVRKAFDCGERYGKSNLN